MGRAWLTIAGAMAFGALVLGAGPARAFDTCQYAFDNECDEPGIGTGACPYNTDSSDCTARGPNTCQYAYDGECDEPGIGTGACTAGTDSADCRRSGNNNTCEYAYDRECDEPGIGTGACAAGTDSADCRGPAVGGRSNSCEYAFDGECDEPGIGTGFCVAGTDSADCRAISVPSDLVFSIQRLLRVLGYQPGIIDGKIGPRTRSAILAFQRDFGLAETGQATQDLLEVMQRIVNNTR